MDVATRPLSDVTEHAIRVLAREIGVADTARFLQQFGAGAGDYSAQRADLFGDLTLDEVVARSRAYGIATVARGPA